MPRPPTATVSLLCARAVAASGARQARASKASVRPWIKRDNLHEQPGPTQHRPLINGRGLSPHLRTERCPDRRRRPKPPRTRAHSKAYQEFMRAMRVPEPRCIASGQGASSRKFQGATLMHDIVIRGGKIVDGTGKAAFSGDIAI